MGGSTTKARADEVAQSSRNAEQWMGGKPMAARIKRDYGTAPCAYCGQEFQKPMGRSTCCCRKCQAMAWYDKNKRKGPKPRLIVEGVTYGSN